MKNSTVEVMVRNQFNIPANVKVNVIHHATITDKNGTHYEFEVLWVDDDKLCQVTTTLPHLNIHSQQLG